MLTTLGQLATVTAGPLQANYVYDADTWRIKRTVGAVTTYTLRAPSGQPLREYEQRCGTFRWTRDYVYAGGRLVGSIRANDGTATIAFVAATSNANENGGSAAVTVRLVTASGQPLACAATVDYQITAGSATEGSDYTLPPLPRRLTFAAGSPSGTTQAVSVPLVNDAIDEAAETFTITLTSPSGAGPGDGLHGWPPRPGERELPAGRHEHAADRRRAGELLAARRRRECDDEPGADRGGRLRDAGPRRGGDGPGRGWDHGSMGSKKPLMSGSLHEIKAVASHPGGVGSPAFGQASCIVP